MKVRSTLTGLYVNQLIPQKAWGDRCNFIFLFWGRMSSREDNAGCLLRAAVIRKQKKNEREKNHTQHKQEPPNSCLVNLGSASFSWLPSQITLGKPGSCLRARQVYRDYQTQKHVLFPWVASSLVPQVSHTRGALFLCHFQSNNGQESSGPPPSGSGTVTIYFPWRQDSISKPGVWNGKVNRASGIAGFSSSQSYGRAKTF